VFFPLIGIAEALFYTLIGCFDCRNQDQKKKKEKKFSTFEDILALANDSPCSFLKSFIIVCLLSK
jgi:hypothetical protein